MHVLKIIVFWHFPYIKQTLVTIVKCKNTQFELVKAPLIQEIVFITIKFYGRLRFICSVLRASKFSVLKIDRNCNFEGLLLHPFWLKLLSVFFGIIFQLFQLLSLAKDHWRGFHTRNAHMVHIVN